MTASAVQTPTGWEGLLDPGERILWQGRPATLIRVGGGDILMMVFGTIFAGFALFWMVMAAQGGGPFWLFGTIHFSLGLGIVLWPVLGRPFVRSRTWYTLTDRRAFIARDLPLKGRDLKSYPVTPDNGLVFRDREPGSVIFASEWRVGRKGGYETRIGFHDIAEARQVYALMRQVQRGAA
ncbi:aspartate carbamoyltransferase catalytic subunit [Thetidibacter halocola]|uniref:Aspartate carbamoyltransferase catalytic subunit n=1 Tax=Thetidibacter halocola TaxID=2827239 RepID=A0A8J7WJX1_9RHOB|nr:aspartate carbamoyltransferase catalytic subunit [Thetidibacter halocola]MBS0126354.1 aspartate carbamoyltransferase catalytic subunit [Thetidibacter halocola]